MAGPNAFGLNRRELENEVKWRMRQVPNDPAKIPEFLNQLLVEIIDKNNAAIGEALSQRDRADLPEEG